MFISQFNETMFSQKEKLLVHSFKHWYFRKPFYKHFFLIPQQKVTFIFCHIFFVGESVIILMEERKFRQNHGIDAEIPFDKLQSRQACPDNNS